MNATRKFTRRKYQQAALVAARKSRQIGLFWARQCRKSTTLGDLAFDAMSREAGRNVIGASASLLTGAELISKSLSAAEQALLATREADAVNATMTRQAAEAGLNLVCANNETGKIYTGLTEEDFRALYRSSKLQMRLYFDRTAYSRFIIIAPNPATARGWTGDVLRDECGFTHPDLERDLQVAVKPIMDTDPTFRMVYSSNLPRNSRHPWFEMTLPAPDSNFAPNENGHFYISQTGLLIHRVALADAYAAGHVLYDTREGKPLTYDQFCKLPENKAGLDESYRLVHKASGSSAVDLFALLTAQSRGIGQCHCAFVENDGEFEAALGILKLLGAGPVGMGFDVATTINETSNPSSLSVTERSSSDYITRLNLLWKEKSPDLVRHRIKRVAQAIKSRVAGGAARRLCVDATNEVLFARDLRNALRSVVPVELVDFRVKVDPPPAGYERDPAYKGYLYDLYCAEVNDNHTVLPCDSYFKYDHLLVTKNGDSYECVPQTDGAHGDTMTSGVLAQWGIRSHAGGMAKPGKARAMGMSNMEETASLS